MPMQKGMSFFTTWVYRQVMIVAQKKDRSRFTIKFRENDPAHETTIRILENQGQRNIAPFLVNAVLHYVQCSETPDVSHMLAENPKPLMDKKAIEDIVVGILRQQGIIKEQMQRDKNLEFFNGTKIIPEKREERLSQSMQTQNMVSDDMRSMIARTLSAFRSE